MIGYVLLLLTSTSCRRVVLELNKVPNNTPKGARIYVTGSFNSWNPGDPNYQMTFNEDTKQYEVDLPIGFGTIEYKFTRGDWTTVETDPCGGEISNRRLVYGDEAFERNTIMGWYDLEPENCPRVTLVIQSVPGNTPYNDALFLGGDINGWSCNNVRYRFIKMENGQYILTVPRNGDKMDFKITRGTWETVEMNEKGNEQLQREVMFGKQDTIFLTVGSWSDRPIETLYTKTIVLQGVPKNTPAKSDYFLAGTLNNWNPLDGKYKFTTLANGRKAITVTFTQQSIPLYYKVTRGGWQKVETDEAFMDIENRELLFDANDTVFVTVKTWADMAPAEIKERRLPSPIMVITPPPAAPLAPKPKQDLSKTTPLAPVNVPALDYDKRKKVFIFIDKLPEAEKNDKVYLAGDFNNWNANDPAYQFRVLPNGKRYFLLRLSDYNAHEFKITRGDWEKEEATYKMERPDNRKIPQGLDDDTLHVRIDNWIDSSPERKLTVVLTGVPLNTPASDGLYLTGDFNDWQLTDSKYKFTLSSDGKYVLNIYDFSRKYNAFKITRGSWPTEAASKRGNTPGNQAFDNIGNDTMRVRIERWKDIR